MTDGQPPIPVPEKNPATRVTDALAKWELEVSRAPMSPEVIRLDTNDKLLIPFTSTLVEVKIHWVEYPSLRSYLQCNGPDCLLCRIGRQPEPRDLLPVYDVVAKAVGVLPVSPSVRPHALMPQLMPVIRCVINNERVLIAVARPDRQTFRVSVLDLPDDADAGEEAVLRFQEAFDAGKIDLAGIYQRLPNETLATVPEIATIMKLRGISL